MYMFVCVWLCVCVWAHTYEYIYMHMCRSYIVYICTELCTKLCSQIHARVCVWEPQKSESNIDTYDASRHMCIIYIDVQLCECMWSPILRNLPTYSLTSLCSHCTEIFLMKCWDVQHLAATFPGTIQWGFYHHVAALESRSGKIATGSTRPSMP